MNLPQRDGTGDTGPPRLLFEGFELRLDSGELLRTGSLVRLQPQPAKILEILASRSGEVVSREEIRRLVWGDSYVDSDASLNFCIKEIRRALGDSATSPTFIETVPRRGYRFLKPVTVAPEAGEPAAAPVPLPVSPQPASPRSRLATVGVALALLLLLTFLLGSRFGHSVFRQRLAVLPLDCHGQETADRQACSGITDALTVELSRQLSHEIDVVAPFTAQAYPRKDLRADVILTGEAWPTAQGLRLNVALAQSGGGDRLWIRSFEVELQDAPLVYGEVAREVARTLQLSPPASRPARPKPVPAAYEAYLRAVSLRHQMQYELAAKAFQEAILLDPGFAPAWAELALCRVRNRDKVDATEAAAQRALALDPDLAESHVAVAQVLFRHNLDWAGAGREYRRALALNPGSANAYSAYSFYLMALGRGDEAMAAVRRARELNPASMELGSALAWYLYLDCRYQEALREIPPTLELYSLNAAVTTDGAKKARNSALDTLLNCSLKTGDPATALRAAKGIEEIFNGPQGAAEIHSLDDFWRRREQRIQDLIRKGTSDTYAEAKNALMLGDRDRALDLLTSNCSPVAWASPFAAVEPLFETLHSDPRWSQVLDCLKLPADAPARKRR
jgi:DNA-binding winged helix-turn-helix (wHTH) protein/tetratricopeptide (TPR) repeat protein